MQRDTGIHKTNVNEWDSLDDRFQWPNPEVQRLLRWVGQAMRSMTTFTTGADQVSGEIDAWGWANLSRRGSYNRPHNDPGWLYHFVKSYQGDDLRMSVAFNVSVLETNLPGNPFGGAIGYSSGPRWRGR